MLPVTLSPELYPVVLADDEALYLHAVAAVLEERGHHVVACSDLDAAETAFRRLEREGRRPALVVDLVQPGDGGSHLGGLDLLRRIRPRTDVPVVAMVNSSAAWLEQAAASLGAARVIRKPDLFHLDPEHIDQALRKFAGAVAGDSAAVEPAVRRPPDGRPAGEAPAPAAASAQKAPAEALLGALEELRHAGDRVAILLLLMRLASDMAARGMLLEVDGDGLRALGRFGTDSCSDDRLPLDQDSLPSRAFWSARLQRASRPAASSLPEGLAGEKPGEALALPVLGPDGVVAVVYADSGATDRTLGDMRALVALAGTASLALAALQPIRA